jgi:hypothetical protein
MSQSIAPERKPAGLEVFLGEWRAEGMPFAGADQSGHGSKVGSKSCDSAHKGYWYSGAFIPREIETGLRKRK